MRRFLSLALVLVLCLSMAACGKKTEDSLSDGVLTDPAEQALIRLLAAFPAEIAAAAEKYDPARITRYCIDVASAYHRFYNACRILDAEGAVQQGRIALCLAVRGVIHNILTMFKVNAPETM